MGANPSASRLSFESWPSKPYNIFIKDGISHSSEKMLKEISNTIKYIGSKQIDLAEVNPVFYKDIVKLMRRSYPHIDYSLIYGLMPLIYQNVRCPKYCWNLSKYLFNSFKNDGVLSKRLYEDSKNLFVKKYGYDSYYIQGKSLKSVKEVPIIIDSCPPIHPLMGEEKRHMLKVRGLSLTFNTGTWKLKFPDHKPILRSLNDPVPGITDYEKWPIITSEFIISMKNKPIVDFGESDYSKLKGFIIKPNIPHSFRITPEYYQIYRKRTDFIPPKIRHFLQTKKFNLEDLVYEPKPKVKNKETPKVVQKEVSSFDDSIFLGNEENSSSKKVFDLWNSMSLYMQNKKDSQKIASLFPSKEEK